MKHVLLIEDETDQRELLQSLIQQASYHVTACCDVDAAIQLLQSNAVDIVLSDWKVGTGDGLHVLQKLKEKQPDSAFILMTAYGNVAHAITTLRAGADDYLAKPFDKNQLLFTLARVSTLLDLKRENQQLQQANSQREQLVDMLGRSEAMQQVFRRLHKVAGTQASVLLFGESGTGKELAAQALHKLSDRRAAPFVAVNCAAIPETLFEAEIFGAEKGAYTGADKLKIGRIEAAQSGTLFLDEIGELPLSMQAKLLRFLQESQYSRLGSSKVLVSDLRIVAATNRDLQQEVEQGRFRADLFFRLNVVPIRLPPLRERRDDIPLLIHHFLRASATRHGLPPIKISQSALQQLCARQWIGNVRELANTIERLVVLSDNNQIVEADLNDASAPATAPSRITLPDDGLDWELHERDMLNQALQRAQYNRTQAARLLNLPYKAFLYRLEKYGLVKSDNES